MLTQTPKIISIMAIACAASFAAMPAYAGTSDAVSVQINKADLMSEAGTQRIYYRLKQKAETACQANEGRVSIKQKVAADKCAVRLINGFVTQLNNQRMTAFHQDLKNFTG